MIGLLLSIFLNVVTVHVVYTDWQDNILTGVGANETVYLYNATNDLIDTEVTNELSQVQFTLPVPGQSYSVSAKTFWGVCEEVQFSLREDIIVRCRLFLRLFLPAMVK